MVVKSKGGWCPMGRAMDLKRRVGEADPVMCLVANGISFSMEIDRSLAPERNYGIFRPEADGGVYEVFPGIHPDLTHLAPEGGWCHSS
jgi:hypothetical protein